MASGGSLGRRRGEANVLSYAPRSSSRLDAECNVVLITCLSKWWTRFEREKLDQHGVCQIECVNGTLSVLLGWQAPREAYRELVADARPILWRHRPFPRDLTRDQEQELARRLPARERAFRLGHLAQLPVVPLDRIGRVDQPSDLRSILEHRRQVFPMRFPSPQRNRIAAAPLL